MIRSTRQLLQLQRLPWHCANRVPTAADARLLVKDFQCFSPDLLWLEGPWFGELALTVQKRHGTPLAYRSHNIEHLYLRSQARASGSLRNRVAWELASVGLLEYQRRLMAQAQVVYDISIDDFAWWRAAGVTNLYWLPPLSDRALREVDPHPEHADLLFLGNLQTPNNVNGVKWLVEEVMPKVLQAEPNRSLTVCGSNPSEGLARYLKAFGFVRTAFNHPDPLALALGSRLCLNPVATGSGVQLKTIDLLSAGKPLITTSQGIRGLSSQMTKRALVADSSDEFAGAILTSSTAKLASGACESSLDAFSLPALGAALRYLEACTARSNIKS
jgi:hypothetical protein